MSGDEGEKGSYSFIQFRVITVSTVMVTDMVMVMVMVTDTDMTNTTNMVMNKITEDSSMEEVNLVEVINSSMEAIREETTTVGEITITTINR